MKTAVPPQERFWAKVEFTNACWLWTAGKVPAGYGSFSPGPDGPSQVGAHRWAYEEQIGPIPEGMVLDHLCRNRACVNPDHMEVVTSQENVRRGVFPASSRTHCPAGHEYAGDNLHIDRKGHRRCKLCNRDRLRRLKEQQ